MALRIGNIGIGGMRFKSRSMAVEIVRKAIDYGFNYIDTCPEYRFENDAENSEAWIGEALAKPGYRERLILTSKSSPGNYGSICGRNENVHRGKHVNTIEDAATVMNQSLRRFGQSAFDVYHMWSVHDREIFQSAFENGAWIDGVRAKPELWNQLGVTSHGDVPTVISFLETGVFSYVTIPLNVINRTRLPVADYCRIRGIHVIAMNPFAGGFLARDERLRELALRYLLSLDGVCALIGFNLPHEVDYAHRIQQSMSDWKMSPEETVAEVERICDIREPHCTGCGYCAPCPQGIMLGECLSYYNQYKYMHNQDARERFLWRQWDNPLRLDRCIGCMQCKARCPNRLPLESIIEDAKMLLYKKTKGTERSCA